MEKRVTIESGRFYVYDDSGNAVPSDGYRYREEFKHYMSFHVVSQQPLDIDTISDRISEMLETGDMDTYSLFSKIHATYDNNSDKVRLLEKMVEYLLESYNSRNNLLVTSMTSLEKDHDTTLNALKNIKREI